MKQNAFTEIIEASNQMTSYWMDRTFSSTSKNMRTIKVLTARFVIMLTHYLEMKICDTKTNILKINTKGMATEKNYSFLVFERKNAKPDLALGPQPNQKNIKCLMILRLDEVLSKYPFC